MSTLFDMLPVTEAASVAPSPKSQEPVIQGLRLRNYQSAAVDSVFGAWERHRSVLLVMCTGGGKTQVFSNVINKFGPGRKLVLAHREELIFQAAKTLKRWTGRDPAIEMSVLRADAGWFGVTTPDVVVASVQTLNSADRLKRFKPEDFSLVVIDEADLAVAESYRKVIAHFRQNPQCRFLGVTATPDRLDGVALGSVFDAAPFSYDIREGCRDGWLVPVRTAMPHITGLDFSVCRTTCGDLNGADLAKVMEEEGPLHKVAGTLIDLAGPRRTLVFCVTVAQATRMSEILNRPGYGGCARMVCGDTPSDERRAMFREYEAGKFQYLVNVGVASRGTDLPSVSCVAVARPTKSRSLYVQMLGRGTRPLPGTVDMPVEGEPRVRLDAIAASMKPDLLVIDFVGNAGRHSLVNAMDALAGDHDAMVVAKAKRDARDGELVEDALARAQREIDADRQDRIDAQERARQADIARRAKVFATAKYTVRMIDPFSTLGMEAPRRADGGPLAKGEPASEAQCAFLVKHRIDGSKLSKAEASAIMGRIIGNRNAGLASPRQVAVLKRRGVSTDGMTAAQAREAIDGIAAREGWKKEKPK